MSNWITLSQVWVQKASVLSLVYVVQMCQSDLSFTFQGVKVKVKQFLYRPGQALRVSGGWGSQILTQSEREGGKFVIPTHRQPLSLGNIPGTHFCWRLSRPYGYSAVRRIMPMKNSNVTVGNRTRDLPACSLNQSRHRVPHHFKDAQQNIAL